MKNTRRDASRPKAIDLFSGCGGATEGLKRAGFSVAIAIENDASAALCYEQNHPEVDLIKKNIGRVSDEHLLASAGTLEIALVAGCPPCQGFSRIRTKNSQNSVSDPRNSLYLHFIRVVRLFRPPALMLENVPNFAEGSRFKRLCRELRDMGYQLTSEIIDAAHYGVPQRRKRLLLVGLLSRKPVLAQPSTTQITVRDALATHLKSLKNDPLHNLPHRISEVVQLRISSIPKNGGSRSALRGNEVLKCHRKSPGTFNDVYGRMRWDQVSPTVTAGVYSPSKGRFLHPDENRCISLREAALLQSFPIDYKFPIEIGKMKLASLIGNALPPEFIRLHAKAVRNQLTSLK